MTPKEIVKRTIRFQGAPRMPYELPEPFGTDFHRSGLIPGTDDRIRDKDGTDEWGSEWRNLGFTGLGEVKGFPLDKWEKAAALKAPDPDEPRRYRHLEADIRKAGDLFILADGQSLYERIHFLRGLENTWMDIYDEPDKLRWLIDVLVDINIKIIRRYADAGVDGYSWADDWGLQDRLMISPEAWHEFWKPAYARVYAECHAKGLLTFLHSCGNIVSILDGLIEAGLDVIQMDQQENMGLDLLGERFGGRITFWNPVDIQKTMSAGTTDEIRAYARKMVRALGRPNGGFIGKWYKDPRSAGHRPEAVQAMAEEFASISGNYRELFEHPITTPLRALIRKTA